MEEFFGEDNHHSSFHADRSQITFVDHELQTFHTVNPGATPSSTNNIVTNTATVPSAKSSSSSTAYTKHHADRWQQRFQELDAFKQDYGSCCVPSYWPQNPKLAQWVKRQRSQYKLKKEGKHSNITDEREMALQNLGFIWDSHAALWEERFDELVAYRNIHGHCNIPTKCPVQPQLAIWAKCQRRQFKLFMQEDPRSNMNLDRISKLLQIGFVFNPRGF